MAGKIVADTIEGTTTSETRDGASVTIPNSIDTKFVVNGSAKAWFNFNGSGDVALSDSFNMSSVADNTTGTYTPAITSAMGNTDYAVVVGGQLRTTGSAINLVFQIRATTIGTPNVKTTTEVKMEGKRPDAATPLDIGSGHGSFMGYLE